MKTFYKAPISYPKKAQPYLGLDHIHLNELHGKYGCAECWYLGLKVDQVTTRICTLMEIGVSQLLGQWDSHSALELSFWYQLHE